MLTKNGVETDLPPVVTRECATCGKTFKTARSRVFAGKGRYCSRACGKRGRRITQPDAKRFWGRVAKGDGCWEWTGGKDTRGYGVFSFRGFERAHRIAWILSNGPIPDGMCICHHCDNPGCVRPDHLFLGTDADNSADKVSKDRHTRGERAKNARLTDSVVKKMRALAATGMSRSDIARLIGAVCVSTACKVINGRKWKHLLGATAPLETSCPQDADHPPQAPGGSPSASTT